MIEIRKFECNMFQENCYVVSDETRECVIIDCGAFYPEERSAVAGYIKENDLSPRHLVSTHGHIDHNFGNNTIAQAFQLKPEVHAADAALMANLRQQAQSFLSIDYTNPTPEPTLLKGEDCEIIFGTHRLSLIHTPGHTPGSVMLYCEEEKVVFSGDTLFRMSIGRTDFQFGSYTDIISSLKRVAAMLPLDTVVLPGHGPQTTIGFELEHNPYITGAI